jgi:hypothetical protein
MVNLVGLFDKQEVNCPKWDKTKSTVKSSIDECLSQGKVDKETLLIMKELVELYKPVTMSSYIEE